MKKKPSKVLIVIGVIALVALVTAFNNWRAKQASVVVDAKYISENMGTPTSRYDVEEVLCVEKFTDNESVAVALCKDSKGDAGVFVMWDGLARYNYEDYRIFEKTQSFQAASPITVKTKFGDVYYCLFTDPQADTVEVNGETHRVYRFSGVVDGEERELGFYCGFNEK